MDVGKKGEKDRHFYVYIKKNWKIKKKQDMEGESPMEKKKRTWAGKKQKRLWNVTKNEKEMDSKNRMAM